MRRWLNRILSRIRAMFAAPESINVMRYDIARLRAVEVARSIELLQWNNPRFRDPLRLLASGFQVNSRADDDGMIREIFRRIGTESRVFLEIGVGDGLENNTAFLLAQGWTGYWLDAGDDFQRRPELQPFLSTGQLRATAAFVTRENAAELARRLGVPPSLDLLSIDIDQNTYYVWEALRDLRPRAAVIEYNASIPPDLDWKVRYAADRIWDRTFNFGAGLKALERLGTELGYCLVGCDMTGANAFFVRRDLVGDRFAAPFTAENHFEPPRFELLPSRGHPRTILDPMPPE